jgi:hypothetical protein
VTPRIGWREVVIAVIGPLFLAAIWVWRFGDVQPRHQALIAGASAAALALGALFGFRRVLGSVRARRTGRSDRADRVTSAVGMGLAITGVVLLRLLVPDAIILVGVAAVAGMLGAGLPAYAAASGGSEDQHRAGEPPSPAS